MFSNNMFFNKVNLTPLQELQASVDRIIESEEYKELREAGQSAPAPYEYPNLPEKYAMFCSRFQKIKKTLREAIATNGEITSEDIQQENIVFTGMIEMMRNGDENLYRTAELLFDDLSNCIDAYTQAVSSAPTQTQTNSMAPS